MKNDNTAYRIMGIFLGVYLLIVVAICLAIWLIGLDLQSPYLAYIIFSISFIIAFVCACLVYRDGRIILVSTNKNIDKRTVQYTIDSNYRIQRWQAIVVYIPKNMSLKVDYILRAKKRIQLIVTLPGDGDVNTMADHLIITIGPKKTIKRVLARIQPELPEL